MCMPSHSEEQSRHSHCSVGGRDLKAISSERERPKKKWTRPVVRLQQPLPMVVVHNISEKSPHQGCKEIKAVHSTWVYNLGCLPSKRRHDQKGSSILVPDALEHTYFKPDIRCCVQLIYPIHKGDSKISGTYTTSKAGLCCCYVYMPPCNLLLIS